MKLFLCNSILSFFCFVAFGQADDCALGVGNKDTETIKAIFQLSEEQIEKMDTWIVELQSQSREIEDQMGLLLDSHPQSTEADLINLANKYSRYKDELVQISVEYDQKLLGVFNDKQYAYYVSLCKEAKRKPLIPAPEEEEEE